MSTHHSLPAFSLSAEEFGVLGSMLLPYIQFIRTNFPDSPERGLFLAIIVNLKQRLEMVQAKRAAGQLIALSGIEFSILDQAISYFVIALQSVVPQTKQRDDTIHSCLMLQKALQCQFMSQNKHSNTN